MDEDKWEGIDQKPLNAVGRDRWRRGTVVSALRRDGIEVVISEVHYKNAGRGVKAQAVIKNINTDAHDKTDQHKQKVVCIDREKE